MKRIFAVILAAALMLTLGACGQDPGTRTERSEVSVVRDDPQTGASVAGGLLTVRLEGNPSTGYEWHWTVQGDDCLQSAGEPELEMPDNPEGNVGVPGVYIYSFKATAAGTATVHFEYVSPSGKKIADTMDVTVVSSKDGEGYKLRLSETETPPDSEE